MRALTQADIFCNKVTRFAKSIEQSAKHECETIINDLALRRAQAKILELEEKLAQMGKLAHEDPLTGILNRRGCDVAFSRELSRADRRQTPLSVVVMDIDNFKRINDQFGHATGDAALVHYVRVIIGILRTSDIFTRLGGEEFLLILPDTDLTQAELVMARIQAELAAAVLHVGPATLSLTFSAGISGFRSGDTQERLIDRADFGTQAAKKKGKNCIVCTPC